MSARGLLLATCAGLLAAGCGAKPAAEAPAGTASASAVVMPPVETPAVAAPVLRRVRGNAVVGKDGYGVVPCGEQEQLVFAVGADNAARPALDKFLEGGAREFFLDGWMQDGAEGGGRPEVLRFERLYTEGPGCDEPLDKVSFAARGTEPFWSLIDGEGGLQLERPDQPPVQATATWREESGVRTAEAETPAGKLLLRLVPGQCSDGMSDTLYGWIATAQLGEQEFAGCGFAGLAPAKP